MGRTAPNPWKIRRFRKFKGSPDPDARQSKQRAVDQHLRDLLPEDAEQQGRDGQRGYIRRIHAAHFRDQPRALRRARDLAGNLIQTDMPVSILAYDPPEAQADLPEPRRIIPGSQGSRSFIVRGRGNPESFESCSHGAGRKIGRNEARRTLILEEETRKLNQKGVLHSIRGRRDLDEAPGAYKDIDEVIGNQADLVEVLIKLEPLAVMKG